MTQRGVRHTVSSSFLLIQIIVYLSAQKFETIAVKIQDAKANQ